MISRPTCATAGEGDPEEDDDEPYDAEAEKAELRDFRLGYKIAHLSYGKQPAKLFELVEQRGFLAEQADYFGGFQQPGEDVEKHVLPAAILAGDWERFVRFAAVAANLRALAEDLADPYILRALVSGGREALARDLAAHLARPVRRAEAHAVIAAAYGRGHPACGELLRKVAEDLQVDVVDDEGDGRGPLPSLIAIARRFGPELDSLWPGCLPRLVPAPEDAARVWQAVSQAWLERGDALAPGFWHTLSKIGDPYLIVEVAPERLADLKPDDPWEVLERLGPLLDAARRWTIATFLGRLARTRPDQALAAWERWARSESIPWSAEIIEASRELIVRLDLERIEEFCSEVEDPSAQAALRVIDLESRPDERRAASALAALRQLPPDDRLHWSLRYVASQPPEVEEELRRKLSAIASFLYDVRFEAPPRDLRLFLDLVDQFQPDELKAYLEAVVWSPASKPETLLTLACETKSEQVTELLLENAERYAAAVAPTAAEGFQLRRDLLLKVTERLCTFRGSAQELERVAGRLLPEEEDDLRAVLAQQLRSREIAEGIRDRRRRLLVLLEATSPGEIQDLLAARSLYASVAKIEPIEDEIQGLSTLLEYPLNLAELAEKRIGTIRDSGIRLQALLRLAWHSLAFQESFYGGQPDRVSTIEMVRSAFVADTDVSLVTIMPQIAELSAQVEGARAVAELQEAARRLVRLDSAPWWDRLEAFERLLACIPSIFLAPGNRQGARRAAKVLEAVARLPLQSDAGAAQKEIQSHWHEVLPIVTAVLDRLEEKVASRVRRAFRTALSFRVTPIQRRVFELCALPPGERLARIDHCLRELVLHPEEIRAFAYLLAVPAPERVSEVLELLPADSKRDDLGLLLIRNGWLPPEKIPAFQPLFSTPEAWQKAEIWLTPDRGSWCRILAHLAARGEVDPSAPGTDPLIRRLWGHSTPGHLQILAQSVLDALRTGGQQRGETALRLWLHARLAPKPGSAQRESQELAKELSSALHRALELASVGQQGG